MKRKLHLTPDDLWRFLDYNVSLYRIHKRVFDTVIFVKEPTDLIGIDEDRLIFKPIIVQCSKIDADDILAELKRDIKDGKPINELKLIYLPLFRSTLNANDLFLESAGLIHDMKVNDSLKRKIIALSILIAGKVVDQDILNKVYREVKTMYSDNVILRVAENYGAEREKEEIARKMLAKGMDVLDVMYFTGVTTEQMREIRESMSKEAVLA